MRISFAGPVGLDFTTILHLAEVRGLDPTFVAELLPAAERAVMAFYRLKKDEHGDDD